MRRDLGGFAATEVRGVGFGIRDLEEVGRDGTPLSFSNPRATKCPEGRAVGLKIHPVWPKGASCDRNRGENFSHIRLGFG